MDSDITHTILYGIQYACNRAAQLAPQSNPEIVRFCIADSEWDVHDYFPVLCKHLRTLYGIEEETYIKSWTIPPALLSPSTGAGRSGSLFQKSNDKRFIFKTIPGDEFTTLVSLFPAYYAHMSQQENSLIAPVFGVLMFDNVEQDDTYYVIILNNVCNFTPFTPPEFTDFKVFDLKGRVPKPGHFVRIPSIGSILKDNNLDRQFYLPMRNLDLFHKQLKTDVKFLSEHNLMDYSLLIGVASRNPEQLHNSAWAPMSLPYVTSVRSVFHCVGGGTPRDNDCSEIYFLGIIDYLTHYGKRKTIANAFKTMRWYPKQLSTIPASEYAQRFLSFFQDRFQPSPVQSILYHASNLPSMESDGVCCAVSSSNTSVTAQQSVDMLSVCEPKSASSKEVDESCSKRDAS
jgi:hypothetical protein